MGAVLSLVSASAKKYTKQGEFFPPGDIGKSHEKAALKVGAYVGASKSAHCAFQNKAIRPTCSIFHHIKSAFSC